jgi:hypothetical protein
MLRVELVRWQIHERVIERVCLRVRLHELLCAAGHGRRSDKLERLDDLSLEWMP